MSVRIVLTGPESTGKSDLTVYLGKTFQVPFALEYARSYLEAYGPDYDYDLLLKISRGHRVHQKQRVPTDVPLGILDTDLINYKIWCDVAYGKCHDEIIERMKQESHHRYILCAPDLPWTSDPLREHPAQRDMLFERHLQEIRRLARDYVIIRGVGADRYDNAREAFITLSQSGMLSND